MYPVTAFKIFITGVLFSLLSFSAQAQVDKELLDSKPKYVKKAGKRSFKNGDYFSAVEFFKRYLEKKPDKLKVKFYLANS